MEGRRCLQSDRHGSFWPLVRRASIRTRPPYPSGLETRCLSLRSPSTGVLSFSQVRPFACHSSRLCHLLLFTVKPLPWPASLPLSWPLLPSCSRAPPRPLTSSATEPRPTLAQQELLLMLRSLTPLCPGTCVRSTSTFPGHRSWNIIL